LRLRGLLASMPGAYLVVQPNGELVAADNLRSWLMRSEALHHLDDLGPNDDVGGLVRSDFNALRQDIATLSASGLGFTRLVRVQGAPRALLTTGQLLDDGVVGEGAVVLWFSDATESQTLQDQWTDERIRLSIALDAATALIESAPFPIWRRDPDLALVTVNSAYVAAVDAVSAQKVIEGRIELANAALATPPHKGAQRARDLNVAQTQEMAAIVKGARRTLQVTDVPLGVAGVGGFAVDMTEREELRQEIARFVAAQRETLDMLSTPVAIFGPDRRLIFHNSAYARLFKLDPAWLADQPHHGDVLERLRIVRMLPEKVDFPGWKRQVLDQYVDLLKPHEEMWHLPDDTTLRVVTQPHPLGGLQLLFEDVTERLVLERSFDTLIKVQQATLNNLHEGVSVFRADGQLVLSNAAFAELWQLDRDWLASTPHVQPLLARCAPMFATTAPLETLRSDIRAVIVARKTVTGKLERVDDITITYAGVPLPDGSALMTFLDVSDSQRIERALRERSEALEAADRLKSEFVANVSYDLRTPLTSIIGFAQMLEQGYWGSLTSKQAEYLRAILTSSDRLMVLINDILDMAVTEAGVLVLDRAPVAIEPMVQSVATMVEDQVRARSLSLLVRVDASTGEVDCDERRLKQVLYNLIHNAIQFTPAGGTVSLIGVGDATSITLQVIDTGVGIDEEQQAMAFDRFRRRSNTSVLHGTGLGLALVKHFVDMHGGTVTLYSKVGEGTRITLSLPRHPPDSVSHINAAQ
jgi:signal transduction histidine kinase